MPILVPLIRTAFRITPDSAERSRQRVHEVFREVDKYLRDGRRFLVGDRFTAADLTFAALASPVLHQMTPSRCVSGRVEVSPMRFA